MSEMTNITTEASDSPVSNKTVLRLDDVRKSFGNTQVLRGISFDIHQHEVVALLGPSGSGKSTLMKCVNLLEQVDDGQIWLGNTDITDPRADQDKIRARIGVVFQQFNLFAARTVYENIAFPLRKSKLSKKEKQEKVKQLLKLVELEEKADVYPSQLSGGQKQRVAIARALASDPQILLSDESTSALDPKTTKAILELLKKVNKELGITIVVITHEMQVIKDICDRVAVMKGGAVVESGKVFDIFANPKEAITREFVENTTNLSKITELVETHKELLNIQPGEVVLRSSYIKRDVSEALVSQISRKFELNVNIIFGNIELIGGNPIGGLVSIVQGDAEQIDAAIEYLKDKNVGVEVIFDGRVSK